MKTVVSRALLLAMFCFFAVSCCHSSKHKNLSSLYQTHRVHARDATVYVSMNIVHAEHGIHMGSGTGVAIANDADNTFVLTAGHICQPFLDPQNIISEFIVTTFENESHYAKIIAISAHHDVCLVSIPELIPIAKLAWSEPSSGDKVYYSGYPTGFYFPNLLNHFDGYMAGRDTVGDHLYNIPATGGSSGSPVYNSSGELIGLVSAVMVDFEHMTFGVGTENIRDFLRETGYLQDR